MSLFYNLPYSPIRPTLDESRDNFFDCEDINDF
jgi:hypothetical protein